MEPPDPAPDLVVRCRGIGRTFATATAEADVVALEDVDLDIVAGTLVAIAGPSGSGKSTLLAIVGCVDRASSGTVRVQGIDIQQLSRRQRRAIRRHVVATLLPQPSDNLFDHFDALGNVAWAARRAKAPVLDAAAQIALLDELGIADCATKRIRQMSGGEQQRLALACALAGQPNVVLADEPTASLDTSSGQLVVAALRGAVDRGATVVVATHDHDVIAAADTVVWLAHGHVEPSR